MIVIISNCLDPLTVLHLVYGSVFFLEVFLYIVYPLCVLYKSREDYYYIWYSQDSQKVANETKKKSFYQTNPSFIPRDSDVQVQSDAEISNHWNIPHIIIVDIASVDTVPSTPAYMV